MERKPEYVKRFGKRNYVYAGYDDDGRLYGQRVYCAEERRVLLYA